MTSGRVAAVLFGLILVAAMIFGAVGATSVATSGSSYSAEDDGRRAAFLLLEALGLAPEAWREAPGLLPGGAHLVWIARAPKLDEDALDEDDPLLRARADGVSGLGRYAEFARQGGTVLLPATKRGVVFARHLELPDELVLPAPWKLKEALVLSGGGLEEAPGAAGVELRDAGGRIAAVALPVGKGTVAFLAGGKWADNSGLAEGDNAAALVRVIERFSRGGRVLFDERALDGVSAGSAAGIALAPSNRLLTLHLLLLALLVAWGHAWVREFPRDPEPVGQLAPLARARAQAGLLVSSGRADVLADQLRAGARRRLRDGIELDAALNRTVQSPAELAELDRDLRAFEAQLHRTAGGRASRGRTDPGDGHQEGH